MFKKSSNTTLPKAASISYIPKEALAQETLPACKNYQPIEATPFSPQGGNTFNPKTALWLINSVIYAYHQYCSENEQPIFPPEVKNGTILHWHTPFNLLKEIQCGYIGNVQSLPNDPTNRIVIAIRGTEKNQEWLANLDISQTAVPISQFNKEVKIHAGFLNTLTEKVDLIKNIPSLLEQIETWLSKELKPNTPNEIYIIGHSLGAAVTTLLSFDLILNFPNTRIISYTIGAPRPANRSFSSLFKQLTTDPSRHFTLQRIDNIEDLVTNIPFSITHTGKDPILYSQINTATGQNSSIERISFTENLGSIVLNHHPTTYYYAIKELFNKTT